MLDEIKEFTEDMNEDNITVDHFTFKFNPLDFTVYGTTIGLTRKEVIECI